MSDLKLYTDRPWISPYVYSSYVALLEKGLDFDVIEIGLNQGEHRTPEYKNGSVTGRVPSLRHGDFWLAESSAIDEYLEDVFPAPKHPRILPADAKDRARARQLMAWLRSDLMALREERPTSSIFYAPAKTPLSDKGKEAAQKLISAGETLIKAGRNSLFAEWCIADADLGLMLQRLNLNGDPLPAALKSYADAQWQRPSARRFIDHPRPLKDRE